MRRIARGRKPEDDDRWTRTMGRRKGRREEEKLRLKEEENEMR